MKTAESWFTVDRDGLATMLGGRDKAFALFELIQNSWDEDVTEVTVDIKGGTTPDLSSIQIIDDSPEGFRDMTHAYTMFAGNNTKRFDPTKRGRFSVGEKLVLSICEAATIKSTKGTVVFQSDGRRVEKDDKTEKGTIFTAVIRISDEERRAVVEAAQRLIPPKGVRTVVNGEELPMRTPIMKIRASIPTVVQKGEQMISTTRRGYVELYDLKEGEKPWIYEMGIPVVEIDHDFHINVLQKVPLNMDRDNITPAYRKILNVTVLNHCFEMIEEKEQASGNWVREAMGHPKVSAGAFRHIQTIRFGEKVVLFDSADREANAKAVHEGYMIVNGAHMTKEEWANAKKHAPIQVAGKVTPSNSVIEEIVSEQGSEIKEKDWTEGMRAVAEFSRAFCNRIYGFVPKVRMIHQTDTAVLATYWRMRSKATICREPTTTSAPVLVGERSSLRSRSRSYSRIS
jgi:hypothetical protein